MEGNLTIKPKVSIVIPVYNSETSIIRTLESVANQTYTDYEIVIINDGSFDASLQLITEFQNRYPHKLIQIISQQNSGVSKARNVGLLAAKGEWVALLDSDDEWLPDKLKVQIDVLTHCPEIDFLGCALVGQLIKIKGKNILSLHRVTCWDLLLKMLPQTSTAIFRKDILSRVGLYNESMTHAEDGNLWIRICLCCNFYVIPDALVVYGGGKPGFGATGLAGNLEKMYEGERINLRYVLKCKYIGRATYLFLLAYGWLKYIRRVVIVKCFRF